MNKPVRSRTGTLVPRQVRAVRTRRKLIEAARSAFATDGFEHARLEDIAVRAGKTRGAFYANFADKEDVFFAIFEEDLAAVDLQVDHHRRAASTTEQRVAALADRLATLLCDRQRSLLYLEFKMYAIRHPRKRERLSDLHAAVCQRSSVCAEMKNLFPEMGSSVAEAKPKKTSVLGAVMDGLALNSLFDPGSITPEQTLRFLRLTLCEALNS